MVVTRQLTKHNNVHQSGPQRPAAAGSDGRTVMMRDMPRTERPLERLIMDGVEALGTRDLLAIIIRSGHRRASALNVADELLTRAGSLRSLAAQDVADFQRVRGIGPVKAGQIKAALELARRLGRERQHDRVAIHHPGDVAALLMDDMRVLDREVFKVLLLDTRHRVMKVHTLSIGDLSGTLVHPRELFKDAIRNSSAAVILAHNHPSGDPEPSPEDLDLTQRLVAGGRLLGIEVLDHIVIGDNTYVSMKQRGLVSGL